MSKRPAQSVKPHRAILNQMMKQWGEGAVCRQPIYSAEALIKAKNATVCPDCAREQVLTCFPAVIAC